MKWCQLGLPERMEFESVPLYDMRNKSSRQCRSIRLKDGTTATRSKRVKHLKERAEYEESLFPNRRISIFEERS